MSRTITAAAIQMEVTPAPTLERLARAQRLIEQAAQDGAQLDLSCLAAARRGERRIGHHPCGCGTAQGKVEEYHKEDMI